MRKARAHRRIGALCRRLVSLSTAKPWLQPDLFEAESQPDLFGAEGAPAYRPDADKVRARLNKILAEARAANTLPWEPSRASLYRTIFPQMTLFLPDEEGAQFRFAFDSEMARLTAA